MVERIDAAGHAYVGAAFAAVDSAAIRVHRERCAKVRNRNVECLKCAAACTSGCIALVDGELVIDAARCVGCGTCATVCPTCALEALNPSDAELTAACLQAAAPAAPPEPTREVVIACSQLEEALGDLLAPGAVASVVCAGRVDESLLASLAAAGVGAVTVLCGRCDRCVQRHGRDTAALVAATTDAVLGVWGVPLSVTVTDDPTSAASTLGMAPEAARAAWDAFFAEERACAPVRASEAAGDGAESSAGASPLVAGAADADAAVSAAVSASEHDDPTQGSGMRFYWSSGRSRKVTAHSLHVMGDGTLPHFIPDRRERLLDALALMGEPVEPSVACRLWGTVVIDGTKCVSCRMCATFCPTGAIAKFDEADGTLGVVHRPSDCVKCGSCADICPADAITVLDGVRTAALAEGTAHRYVMTPRPVSLTDNPHQILDTFRLDFDGDIFER